MLIFRMHIISHDPSKLGVYRYVPTQAALSSAFEHVHEDFIETWKFFKVHSTHPDYRKQFKSCVVYYDSHHISYI